ncbi:MAG: acetyl-CoA carboxylase biotin carboxyl carrier protein [Planctomycetes bacterium]|nr:acetyl-CoA carboxylase biotin carboxyl carrier protein [Planctomycetota bacterium]
MSEDVTGNECPFDLERLRELIEMMEQYGLSEVSLARGDEKWRLRRGDRQEFVQVPASIPAAPVPAAPVPAASSETTGPSSKADNTISIKSPTVGTFYAAPNPDDPPFVTVGTKVNPDTIVCIVEAMKVFNQIPAEVSGTIEELLVSNGDPVEFGQPLYRVRPG